MKRALSTYHILSAKFFPAPFDGEWRMSFGTPELHGLWFVYGASFSGKTTFCLRLGKYLTKFVNRVAYNGRACGGQRPHLHRHPEAQARRGRIRRIHAAGVHNPQLTNKKPQSKNTKTMENTTMIADELAAFKAAKAAKRAREERKANLETYNTMTDEQVRLAIPELQDISGQLSTLKRTVFDNFRTLLDMKKYVMKKTADGQRSHTFTTTDGTMRLELGYYQLDNYKDTVNDGIALIKEYISGLAKDEETKALVDMVLKLLSKDQKGNLKASRVLQLRNIADKLHDEKFSEGVEIIMDAYAPIPSKQFVRAWTKGSQGEWVAIPLSITDVK